MSSANSDTNKAVITFRTVHTDHDPSSIIKIIQAEQTDDNF